MAVSTLPSTDLLPDSSLAVSPTVIGNSEHSARGDIASCQVDTQQGVNILYLQMELNRLPDLVTGGEIVHVSNESFAEAFHLLDPKRPQFAFGDFDPKRGQKFQTWESARHSPRGHEYADMRLGTPGMIRTLAISTQWHDGNHAQAAALFASQDGDTWTQLLAPTSLDGHSLHVFELPENPIVWSHVRLVMYPDGGIARLKLLPDQIDLTNLDHHSFTVQHGVRSMRSRHFEDIPKPSEKSPFEYPSELCIRGNRELASWGEPLLLSSLDLGARIAATSNQRYSHAGNLLKSAVPENMGDGWENARYRLPLEDLIGGNYDRIWEHSEWVVVQLADRGTVQSLRTDFRFYNFNAPALLQIEGCDLTPGQNLEDVRDDQWTVLVKKMDSKQFSSQSDVQLPIEESILSAKYPPAFTHVRIKIFPCGGMHRFHVFGKRVLRTD